MKTDFGDVVIVTFRIDSQGLFGGTGTVCNASGIPKHQKRVLFSLLRSGTHDEVAAADVEADEDVGGITTEHLHWFLRGWANVPAPHCALAAGREHQAVRAVCEPDPGQDPAAAAVLAQEAQRVPVEHPEGLIGAGHGHQGAAPGLGSPGGVDVQQVGGFLAGQAAPGDAQPRQLLLHLLHGRHLPSLARDLQQIKAKESFNYNILQQC